MKLGASYNLFDSEELLEASILSIRDNVDYISVVFQTQSNIGNPCNEGVTDLLIDLRKRNLIDEVVHYNPDLDQKASSNERIKRNIGLNLSREKGCTHHLSIDSDEFYEDQPFKDAKDIIEHYNYDGSACKLLTYYKNNHTVLEPMEEYYVSFIFKIRDGIEYAPVIMPVLVDPTRRMEVGMMLNLEPFNLLMHHFSYVRKDLRLKIENSSANVNWNSKMTQDILDHFNAWQEGMDALVAPASIHSTKQIKPYFDVHF